MAVISQKYLVVVICSAVLQVSDAAEPDIDLKLPAQWEYTTPFIAPEARDAEPSRAQKDPTIVRYRDRWHVFMTVKLPGRSAIEYCSFTNWENANESARTVLTISDSQYFCAPPSVLLFAAQKVVSRLPNGRS